MNQYLLFGIVALAIAATGAYFFGVRKNRALAAAYSAECEGALRPKDRDYVNIGGAIGFQLTYRLGEPWTEAKGTITLAARQSLLYLPVSLLLGMRDRFAINVFTARAMRGEGHLLSASWERAHGASIEGRDRMKRETLDAGGKHFVILYDHDDLAPFLKTLAENLPQAERFRHFCWYGQNKTVFLHLAPRVGTVGAVMSFVMPRVTERLKAGA